MILVTGSAGFIGHHLAVLLAEGGYEVIGIDNINDYYDPALKWARLAAAGIDRATVESQPEAVSSKYPNYRFRKMTLEDETALTWLFTDHRITRVCNLAAQAGVRYSITNPQAYVQSNVTGFVNILEMCRRFGVGHLVYASSSSVYGLNDTIPFSEAHRVGQPVSLYAATKRSNELLAHVYSHLYDFPTSGLRFFTVYGPWGRPDMAYSLFSDAMLNGRPIKIFNHGRMSRDFTYVGDIVEGVRRVLTGPLPRREGVPSVLYNIGSGRPVKLLDFVETLERKLGVTAEKVMTDMQAGDVEQTFADTGRLEADYGYRAATPLDEGVGAFVDWYREYYGLAAEGAGPREQKPGG